MPTLLAPPTPPTLLASPVIPVLVDVPATSYLMVDGKGDPSTSAEFDAAWQTLEPLAATLWLLMDPDANPHPMPLECLWWTDEPSHLEQGTWTMMVALPNGATLAHLEKAMETLNQLGQVLPAFHLLRFGRLEEGKAVQVLQRGPYQPEGPTFERLLHFAHDLGYTPCGLRHEIYLSDPRRRTPCPLELLLRYPVRPL